MTNMQYLLNCKKIISLMVLFSFFDNFGMEDTENEDSQNDDIGNKIFFEDEDENILNFNVLLLGESGVGKTCILLKYVSDSFDESQMPTLGVDFRSKKIEAGNQSINLTILDSGGQARFRSTTRQFYKEAMLVVLIFSFTDRDSFDNLENWLDEVKGSSQNAKFLLVGNKIDVQGNKRKVTIEEGKKFANEHEMRFVEVSAKEGTNISDRLFIPFIKKFLENQNQIGLDPLANRKSKNSMGEKNTNSSFCDECCSCCPCSKNSEELV